MGNTTRIQTRHPDSIDGNKLRNRKNYRMRIWTGTKGKPDPEDNGEVVQFVGYFDKAGLPVPTGAFMMKDLANGNYVCRVICQGKTFDLWGDTRIWQTDINPRTAPNRVTFLKMPTSASLRRA